jgi:hypothetical protein
MTTPHTQDHCRDHSFIVLRSVILAFAMLLPSAAMAQPPDSPTDAPSSMPSSATDILKRVLLR